MKELETHLSLLGLSVKDRVTDFEGVVTSVSFDLYGCMQALVIPKFIGKDTPETRWFDANRLEITSIMSVMPVPDFIKAVIEKGGEILPLKD